MSGFASFEDQLEHAFRLAYFLVGDRGAAIDVAATAVARLEVALAAQDRRLYYKPARGAGDGKSNLARYRNRVSYDELHLLQRQVYVEAEPFERLEERAAAGDADQLLISYLKHLVRITIKRNSFYVTLGSTRLLYNYATSESMDVYNAVIQDPDRIKDDYYYRSRKGVLMKELKERFGTFVRIQRGPHGEERWVSAAPSERIASIVADCLAHFTPWRTGCPIADDVDPRHREIAPLCSNRSDDEDRVEVNRIHAILHQDCFRKLASSLGLAAPGDRLDVPLFLLSDEGGEGPRAKRGAHTALTHDEIESVRNYLEELADLRRRIPVAVVRVLVDGVERARLDPAGAPTIRFELDEDVERIELFATDPVQDVLVASHFVARNRDGGLREESIHLVLEDGKHIEIVIGREVHEGHFEVDLHVRETRLLTRAALAWRRLKGSMRLDLAPRPLAAALAALVLAVLVGGGLLVIGERDEPALVGTDAPHVGPPAPPTPEPGPGPNLASPPTDDETRAPVDPPQRPRIASTPPKAGRKPFPIAEEPERDITRSQRAPDAAALRDVRSIYIRVSGVANEQVSHALRDALGTSGRFRSATEVAAADALLDVSVAVDRTSATSFVATARLLSADGSVIWGGAGARAPSFRGSAADVAVRILGNLRSAAVAADSAQPTPRD